MTTINLKQTQHTFLNYLLAPNKKNTKALHRLLSVNQGPISSLGMEIYVNAYRTRFKETIETDHEILCLYLGDDLFEKMADKFIEVCPSQFRSLRDYCDNLPQFLINDAFFCQHAILSDIAKFERALLNSFDAADTKRSDFSELQNLPAEFWPECKLRLHPSVQIFSCKSNAVQSWQALKEKKTPPAADYSDEQFWLIWRSEERVTEFISLQSHQLALIKGVMQGHNFSELCSSMLDWTEPGHAPVTVLKAVKSWFDMKLIQKVVFE